MLTSRAHQMDLIESESQEPHRMITEHHHHGNPLVAQLQVLNKYAAMVGVAKCNRGVNKRPFKKVTQLVVEGHCGAKEMFLKFCSQSLLSAIFPTPLC